MGTGGGGVAGTGAGPPSRRALLPAPGQPHLLPRPATHGPLARLFHPQRLELVVLPAQPIPALLPKELMLRVKLKE